MVEHVPHDSGASPASPEQDVFIPDASDAATALAMTTHLGIGAHPDDLEIIAMQGILAAHTSDTAHFTGIVACDGAGSPRNGIYAEYDDQQMSRVRRQEQRDAASLGHYAALVQLGYRSDDIKQDAGPLTDSLAILLQQAQPDVVYLHQLVDRHATHRVLARASLAALRRLPAEQRPSQVYGVEVWGSLDWLPGAWRAAIPIDDPEQLQARLLRCHDSQINGGKRYDLAIVARQKANATLTESHATDKVDACALAMDLSGLVADDSLSVDDYLRQCFVDFASVHAPHT